MTHPGISRLTSVPWSDRSPRAGVSALFCERRRADAERVDRVRVPFYGDGMPGDSQRRHDRQWKLSATLLGLAALLVSGLIVRAADLPSPWGVVAYVGTMLLMLVVGTWWLVPLSDGRHSRSE